MSSVPSQLLVYGASTVVSWDSDAPADADSVLIEDGRVVVVGRAGALRKQAPEAETLDADGGLVVPGFVDGHVHPAFAIGRAEEFDWRAQGIEYLEIARRGGGILSSVAAVRAADEATLTAQVERHFRRMMRHGTTACEAKSGYGLDVDSELKSLRAIAAAAEATGMTVFPTFLGAHMVPAEYKESPDRYLDLLCAEMLPAAKEQGIARAADVFIESGAFTLEQGRRYCERARELGFALRIHADQFHSLGAVAMAVELGAESVDHLEVLDDSGLEALAMAGSTYAGLLPAVPHFLRQKADAPARKLIAAGVPWFLATDFNPGSCYTPSLPEAAHFGRVRLNLTAEEALRGVTEFPAASLGATDRGHLRPGAVADLLVLDLPDAFHFGYAFGENPVRSVVTAGQVRSA